ncbi:MAG: acetolactate synthase, large subunit, biosynthetic type, partial [Clostridia bacterium]|nr:acetolactate synthase, large subunit, biosynthetic type [Clostridia bacterium]
MNGAGALIKVLENEGVQVIFGYPGGAVLPLYDALLCSDIKHVLTRTEQSAAHAACGYSRSTDKVGVCWATSGPGATNLITGIANAYLDSTPLVAITGQVATELIGHDVFQEVDIVGATTPFTKHNYLVKDAADIPRIVKEAFYIANTGRKGPVLIDVPKDIQEKVRNYDFDVEIALRSYKPNMEPNFRQMAKLEEAIKDSKRPLLCVGGGCMLSRVSDKIIELSNKINAPFVTTMLGIGAVPTDHENCLGMIGQSGLKAANDAVESADLVVVLG